MEEMLIYQNVILSCHNRDCKKAYQKRRKQAKLKKSSTEC